MCTNEYTLNLGRLSLNNHFTFVGLINMKISGNSKKSIAVLDKANNRYIIKPLDDDNKMPVGRAVRAIKATHTNWREIAKWCGLKKQSDAFKMAYANSDYKERVRLNKFIAISGDVAYFYDSEHQPAEIETPTIVPLITNRENTILATTGIPVKFATRVTISDSIDRSLEMILSVDSGSINDASNNLLVHAGSTVTIRGNARRLNEVLKDLVFVANKAEDTIITIRVNDFFNEPVESTIAVEVVAGVVPSIPELNAPVGGTVVLNKSTLIPTVTVADADNREMELRITPFGCDVLGLKNTLKFITNNFDVYTTRGTPADINADIAQMKVRAYQENVQVGFELVQGTTKIRKYLVLTATDTEEPVVSKTTVADEAIVDESVVE